MPRTRGLINQPRFLDLAPSPLLSPLSSFLIDLRPSNSAVESICFCHGEGKQEKREEEEVRGQRTGEMVRMGLKDVKSTFGLGKDVAILNAA